MAPKKNLKSSQPPQKVAAQKDQNQPPKWPPLSPLLPSSSLSLIESLPNQILTIPQFFTPTLCKTYVTFLSSLPLTTTPGGFNPKKGNAVRVNDRFQVHDPVFAERLWGETGLRELVLGEGEGEGEGEVEGEGEDEASEKEGKEDREIGEEKSLNHEEEERRNKRERNENLWGGEPLGLNPNIRIYRYTKGQFFAPHYDESNDVSFTTSSPSSTNTSSASASIGPKTTSSSTASKTTTTTTTIIPGKTTWTFLLYLTSSTTGCVGGETVFYPDPIHLPGAAGKKSKQPQPEPFIVTLETGLALLHKHGKECMVHEGRPVMEGEKWVLRSDLVVRR
jgi:hypothetical protein